MDEKSASHKVGTMNYVTSTSMDSRFCVRVNTSGCRYSGAIVHRLRQASGLELRSSKERGIALWTEFAKDILVFRNAAYTVNGIDFGKRQNGVVSLTGSPL